jgi:hypothetical protein
MIFKLPHKFTAIILIFVFVLFGIFFVGASKTSAQTSNVNVSASVTSQSANITNIRVYDITMNDAKITWETDIAAMCTIYYGTSIVYSQSQAENSFINHHYFNLTQLSSSTIYHFKISCSSQHGLSTESEDQTFETLSTSAPVPQAIVGIWQAIKNFIVSVAENPIAQAASTPLNVAAISVVLMSIFLPEILNLPFLSVIDKLYVWILSLAGVFKRRKNWGTVYDSESGEPLSLAKVTIYDLNKNPIKTILTDDKGRYGFLVDPGKYYLTVKKTDYTFPSKIIHMDYHYTPIEVKENGLVGVNIPVDPNLHKLIGNMNIIAKITRVLDWIKIPLLILGTILALIFFIHNPTTVNTLLVVIYAVIWGLELHIIFRPHAAGSVIESTTNKPVESSVIRIYDEKTGHLVATKITDTHGHYYCLVNPGDYHIKATKENFERSEIEDVNFKRGDVLTKDIYLKKNTQFS